MISRYVMFASEGDEVVPERINILSETETATPRSGDKNHISLLKRGQPGYFAGFQTRQNRCLASSDAKVLGALFFCSDGHFMAMCTPLNQRPYRGGGTPGT